MSQRSRRRLDHAQDQQVGLDLTTVEEADPGRESDGEGQEGS